MLEPEHRVHGVQDDVQELAEVEGGINFRGDLPDDVDFFGLALDFGVRPSITFWRRASRSGADSPFSSWAAIMSFRPVPHASRNA